MEDPEGLEPIAPARQESGILMELRFISVLIALLYYFYYYYHYYLIILLLLLFSFLVLSCTHVTHSLYGLGRQDPRLLGHLGQAISQAQGQQPQLRRHCLNHMKELTHIRL